MLGQMILHKMDFAAFNLTFRHVLISILMDNRNRYFVNDRYFQ